MLLKIYDIAKYYSYSNLGVIKMLQNFHASFVEDKKVMLTVLRYPSADFPPSPSYQENFLVNNPG